MGTTSDVSDRKIVEQSQPLMSKGYGNIAYATEYTQDLLHLVELYRQHYPEPVVEIFEELEAIELDFIAEDFLKLLASMQEGADRISQIVLSLRNFSRLDEKEYKQVDIHQGIDSTLLILKHRLKQDSKRPNIQIIKEYGQLPLVDCYPTPLNQVFMNLLCNVIDAINEVATSESIWRPPIGIRTEVIKDSGLKSDRHTQTIHG